MMSTVVTFVVALVVAALAEETYNPKYDSFNARELVDNQRLLKAYSRCFLDQGPCTAEGSDFKRVIPEALATSCGKCTPKQRELVRVVVKALQQKLPEDWNELVRQKDPEGKYAESFKIFLASNN